MTSDSVADSRHSWLNKRIITELQEEGVIVAQIGGVAAPENEHPVFTNLASRVIGPRHGDISCTLPDAPLDRAGGRAGRRDPDGVELVLGQHLRGIGQTFRFLQTTEQVVYLVERDDGVAGDGRRRRARLFDLLPRDGSRLNYSHAYHSNKV